MNAALDIKEGDWFVVKNTNELRQVKSYQPKMKGVWAVPVEGDPPHPWYFMEEIKMLPIDPRVEATV